jgi:manganese/zinc/iron transport system permease protein
MQHFLIQDVPMLAAGILASIACALVGCFLILRKMSLMGDAISHAVLPGIVAGFLFAGTLQAMPIFIGAAIVGVLTVLFTEIIHKLGRVETNASMGVVFTILFAIGVIMLERAHLGSVHLDADCVLYGQMEHVLWTNPPMSVAAIFTAAAWADFPRQVVSLAIVCLLNVLFIAVLFKELRITSFDPALARAQRVSPRVMHYLLMTMVAITVVAAFEAVGSILVVAMLIVPGLIAHLFCDRLGTMLVVAALVAALAAGLGHAAAVLTNTITAGMIGVTLGVFLLLACCFTPNGGWIISRLRRLMQPQPDHGA